MGAPTSSVRAPGVATIPASRPAADRLAVAVLTLDPCGDVGYVNAAWVELTGLDLEASRGEGWLRALAPSDRDRLRDELRRASGVVDCALEGRCGRRWTRWLWQVQPAEAGDSRVVTVIDLSIDHSREERLAEEAARDPLTRVANRRSFLEQVSEALRSRRSENVGVVYLDLDGFKEVNDTGGHALGDALLRLVAQRLRRHLRSGDVLGRVGGDEFAVLCQGPTWELMSVAGRVAEALLEPFHVRSTTLRVTAAVGVAVADGPDDDPEELLIRADHEMYRDKKRSTRGEAAAAASGARGDAPGAARLPTSTTDMVVRRLNATGRALADGRDESRAPQGQRVEQALNEIAALVRDLEAVPDGLRVEAAPPG